MTSCQIGSKGYFSISHRRAQTQREANRTGRTGQANRKKKTLQLFIFSILINYGILFNSSYGCGCWWMENIQFLSRVDILVELFFYVVCWG